MPRSSLLTVDIVAQLSVAVAILAEEISALGVATQDKSSKLRRRRVRDLLSLARDAAILTEASNVLIRRPDLMT
jgi:hypothetical protein